jgi:hypothetical protein
LSKITKVVGVQGVEALAEVAPEAKRPYFLGFLPAGLYPCQVIPQSHRLRLPSQEIELQLALPTAREQQRHAANQQQRQQCGVHQCKRHHQSNTCSRRPHRRHQAIGDLIRTRQRIGLDALQAIVEPG